MTQNSRYIQLQSWQIRGSELETVMVEALKTRGLAQLKITGLPDTWLKDSREKIQALSSSAVSWDALERVLIHILPADEIKNGAHLELPIALACMLSLYKEEIPEATLRLLETYRFVGHLSLDGRLLSTPTIDEILSRSNDRAIGPHTHSSIHELWCDLLIKQELPTNTRRPAIDLDKNSCSDAPAMEGRIFERQCLLLAAVAKVPVLLVGTPGIGKTHLASWARTLVPLQNKVHPSRGNVAERSPSFLCPHSRSNIWEFIGSQKNAQPQAGIFARAHRGLLVLDEFAELNRDIREVLRNILDQKVVQNFSRGRNITFPADFWLIATMNPCPCGQAMPLDIGRCRCKGNMISLYASRISGPVADRFGLKLFLQKNSTHSPLEEDLPFELSQIRALEENPPHLNLSRQSEIKHQLRKLFPHLSERACVLKSKLLGAYELLAQKPFENRLEFFSELIRDEEHLFKFRPHYRAQEGVLC